MFADKNWVKNQEKLAWIIASSDKNIVSNNSPKLVNVAAILRIKYLKIEYIHQALWTMIS